MFRRVARSSRQVILLMAGVLCLMACGEKAPPAAPTPAAPAGEEPAGAGLCVVKVVPGEPHSNDCLNALIERQPPGSHIVWRVNGQPVDSREAGKLFPEAFRRGDRIDVSVEDRHGRVASASVTIANAPPRITGISATPDQVFADSDIQVVPVAEDRDGDPVEFRYQWLVNGQAHPLLTESRLSADHFNKGDAIQVRITPYDGIDEGPVYESYAMTIPNAPPLIESTPPQQFEALAYSYQVKATDRDGDSLTWRLDKAPQGMTIDPASGLVNWSLQGVAPGAYPMRIAVRDPDGAEAFQEFTLTLGQPK